MYNRYIHNEDNGYPHPPRPEFHGQIPPKEQTPPPPPPHCHEPPPPKGCGQIPLLSGILDKLHLGDIDIGDLLLLLLLFHLFKENGDEELLIAIGLLLIL